MTIPARFGALAIALVVSACVSSTGAGIHAKLGYSQRHGLRVVGVPPTGPAADAGLAPDDRIISIDGVPVRTLSLEEVVEKLRGSAGTIVELEVQREGQVHTLQVMRAPYER